MEKKTVNIQQTKNSRIHYYGPIGQVAITKEISILLLWLNGEMWLSSFIRGDYSVPVSHVCNSFNVSVFIPNISLFS